MKLKIGFILLMLALSGCVSVNDVDVYIPEDMTQPVTVNVSGQSPSVRLLTDVNLLSNRAQTGQGENESTMEGGGSMPVTASGI